MTWKTHLIGGAQVGVLLAYANNGTVSESAIIIGSSMIGSLLPDIDHTRSRICRTDSLAGLISHLLSKFTKHRGFTHTIFGALTFAIIFYGLAVFKTEKESLISMASAVGVFLFIHAFAGALRPIAGWLSVTAYAMGPQIASLATDHNISFSINEHSALLCSIGIFAGCMSHILYDAFNKGGIMFLFPFSRKNYRLLEIRTNTAAEMLFNAVQVVVLASIIAVCYREARAYRLLHDLVESISARI